MSPTSGIGSERVIFTIIITTWTLDVHSTSDFIVVAKPGDAVSSFNIWILMDIK